MWLLNVGCDEIVVMGSGLVVFGVVWVVFMYVVLLCFGDCLFVGC